jgi:thioredoxin-related protein
MRIKNWYLLFVVFFSLSVQAMPPDEWQFKRWSEAVAQAKQEKKPLFVLFGFEDCHWCKRLYRAGMSDSTVKSKYIESLALAYVDTQRNLKTDLFIFPNGDQITFAELIKKYQAYPTPSWVFLSESGEVLLSGRGASTTSREFLRDLEIVTRK